MNTPDNERESAPGRREDTGDSKIRVIFLHLDLGIGGAEQLVLQLASASQQLGHDVVLATTRCEPHHCFALVRPPDGRLYSSLRVWGKWIPADLWGRGRTLCSTIRVLYLTFRIVLLSNQSEKQRKGGSPIAAKQRDVIVVDVLPTPLPFLAQFTSSSLLYYCHFPDKLLKRSRGGSNASQQLSTSKHARQPRDLPTRLYRSVMDGFEAWGMRAADAIAVNSSFTRAVTLESFPFLRHKRGDSDWDCGAPALPVLYPALDTSSLDAWRQSAEGAAPDRPRQKRRNRIVSLNRYERKKDLGLLLKAMDWVRHQREHSQPWEEPEIIVAGGYDTNNAENVEHLEELRELASELGLTVDFRCSISDAERAELLHTALAVVYTPSHEHFGIVPLEAMYSETCVVAVNNGGPTESVLHEQTGFLCESTPAAFGSAILGLLEDPDLAIEMGRAGRRHVIEAFGEGRLKTEWEALIEQTIATGERRRLSSRLRPIAVFVAILLAASLFLWLYAWVA